MAVVGYQDVAVFIGNPILVAGGVGGDPEQQAGIARFTGGQAADAMSHQKRTAEAAYITVGHDTGGHHRVDHGVAIVGEIERDRGNPHRGADARGFLAAPSGRNPGFQVDQDLTESPTDPTVGTQERPLGSCQCQIKLGKPLRVDPAMINKDIAEGQSLLRVIGIKPS